MGPPLGAAICPVKTNLPYSAYEEAHPGQQPSEIRAYKLGKKRWSYNQVELLITGGGERRVAIRQTAHAADTALPAASQDSAVCFHVQLESGQKLQAHIYIVYDQRPPECGAAGSAQQQQSQDCSCGSEGRFTWNLVTRADCCKGCQGNVLRSLQRFGRLGKRSWDNDAGGNKNSAAMKDPKYMYISLDEACTHVDASAFRLVAAVYDASGARLLTTAVSPPVRVLANNDVPTGAARIPLEAHLPADWEGWELEEAVVVKAEQEEEADEQADDGPKRTRRAAVKPDPSGSRSGASTPGGNASGSEGRSLPLAASAPPGLALRTPSLSGGCSPRALTYPSLPHSASLPLQADANSQLVGTAALLAQEPQRPHATSSQGPAASRRPADRGGVTRSFSLPGAPRTDAPTLPQSHWQVQQKRLEAHAPTASGGGGAAPACARFGGSDARSLPAPGGGSVYLASQLPSGHSGQWQATVVSLGGSSTHSGSMLVAHSMQPGAALVSPQHSSGSAMPQHHQQASAQHLAQHQPSWAGFPSHSLPPMGASSGRMFPASHSLPIPHQLSAQQAARLSSLGPLDGRYSPLAANTASGLFQAAAYNNGGSAAAHWSLPGGAPVAAHSAPQHQPHFQGGAAGTSAPAHTELPAAANGSHQAAAGQDAYRQAARRAILLQHAEAQLQAASRAAASRGAAGQLAGLSPGQQMAAEQRWQPLSLPLPLKPGTPHLHLQSAGGAGGGYLPGSSLPLTAGGMSSDPLRYLLPSPPPMFDHNELAALVDEVMGMP